jgi:glycosyltransferase involved in cell wall biosynthesis
LLQKTIYHGLMLLCGDALLRKHRKLDQRASLSCDLILANSEYMARRIWALYRGRVEPCLPGIPLPALPPQQSGNGRGFFLSVSRLEPDKHVDEIIWAVDQLARERGKWDVTLVVAGTGAMARSLQEQVIRAGLTSQVRFVGFVSDGKLAEYYQQALAVVCVSENEPFGLVPLEAMARGVPVIAARDGGLMESVIDGVTGICVPTRDVAALAMAMENLLRDPVQATEMGRRGREHVEARFSLTHFVDRFERHIERLHQTQIELREP